MQIQSLQELLARRYGIRPAELQPLVSTGDKHLYRVEQAPGSPLLARMYPAAAKQDVQDHAAMLQYLELRGYPAPRVMSATGGMAVVAHGDSYVLLTGYVEGDALAYTPGDLRLLGEALGRLHALCPVGGARPSLLVAGMLPANELAWATGRLTAVDRMCLGHCAPSMLGSWRHFVGFMIVRTCRG
jgi:Ser/Thr protein kinase RdoA (MazF antagonist)